MSGRLEQCLGLWLRDPVRQVMERASEARPFRLRVALRRRDVLRCSAILYRSVWSYRPEAVDPTKHALATRRSRGGLEVDEVVSREVRRARPSKSKGRPHVGCLAGARRLPVETFAS